ncbi:MAG TPA: TlpA disulfide reductase family protein [Burkholderiaceae bacterium]|jgi:thiol-disulfide isomerase/thioredoxin
MRIQKSIAAITVAAALCTAMNAYASPPKVGDVAPDFEATTFDGNRVTLADFKNQVLIVNFWATWCEPCKKELPLLDSYYRIQQKAGLRIIAVTTEDSLSAGQLEPLARVVSFPMVRKYKGRYGVLNGVPTNYIIDRAGVVRYARAGGFSLEALNKLLVPLLKEPAPEPATPTADNAATSATGVLRDPG